MHTEAERTDRELLPTSVAALLDRNDQRRADRAQPGVSTPPKTAPAKPPTNASAPVNEPLRVAAAERNRNRDQGYGLEL